MALQMYKLILNKQGLFLKKMLYLIEKNFK